MATHLITCEYPPDCGGVSDHTAQLARALQSGDDEVHVWCPGPASPDAAGVRLHANLGGFDRAVLARLSLALDETSGPHRLVVQWVPHGYGYRAMNVRVCLWLAGRVRQGDQLDVVVHEPFMNLWSGSVPRMGVAVVQRVMAAVLLRAARVVWLSTPAWEPVLRPFALGRAVDMRWLPVPGCEADEVSAVSTAQGRGDQLVVGHFGTFGSLVCPLLEERLPGVMAHPLRPKLRLVGRGGEAFAQHLLRRHPDWTGRVEATGQVPTARLGEALMGCDVMLQPYPDGITARRTSVMAALARGRAVVATRGRLTEAFWTSLRAVELIDVDDVPGFITAVDELLVDAVARQALGARAREAYESTFSVRRLVEALRAA